MLGLMQSLAKSAFVKSIPDAAWKYLTANNWNAQNTVKWEDWAGVEGDWVWMATNNWNAVSSTNWEDWDASSET
tara:strand:- start:342 stop:563 length:222 start_codon:yes stop_codon:yes gene_type:complete